MSEKNHRAELSGRCLKVADVRPALGRIVQRSMRCTR